VNELGGRSGPLSQDIRSPPFTVAPPSLRAVKVMEVDNGIRWHLSEL